MMNRSFILCSLLSGALLLPGCVSKKQFAQLESDYKQLQTEKADLDKTYQDTKMKLVACGTNSKSLEERLAEAQKAN